jgi:DNA-binding NtrC family response regulator
MKQPFPILVVDDEEIIRDLLAEAASARGFAVRTAVSGEEAIARVQEKPYPLVILDMNLPGKTGKETAAEIAQLRPETRFIILTGGGAAAAREFKDVPQVAGFFCKPFSIIEFLRFLENAAAPEG